MQQKATARAHPNIAFIKYWGNRDDALRLPANSSISMNLAGLFTETTVRWDKHPNDRLILNGREDFGKALERVSLHLARLRQHLGIKNSAHVESSNNFPTGAGIASSASAFAALSLAAAAAANVELSEAELSTLARLGSGSASRSVPSGFVEWYAADTHEESFARSIAAPDYWDLVDVIAVVSTEHKATTSQAGHPTAKTSDLQEARVAGAQNRLDRVRQAILDRDFPTFAEIIELDSNLMHSVMMTSRPPLFYWKPTSLAIMDCVRDLRGKGLSVAYTLDAGPNVHCISIRKDAESVRDYLLGISGVVDVRLASVGGGAHVVTNS
jgi:diphosphomevalonate decarboxylase